jgi:FKBP-type peptidyl-prolyl cis-trans isomerase SlyD
MMQDDQGNALPVWVTNVGDEEVTVDANHPLAGQNLHFTVSVSAVRKPTDEEVAHGHPHGLTGTESHH